MENEGEALKAESAQLLAQAIELAALEMSGRWDQVGGAHKTVRYVEGGTERIERAQIVDLQCARAVIRNLRGDLVAVPMSSAGTVMPPNCDTPKATPNTTAVGAPVNARLSQ